LSLEHQAEAHGGPLLVDDGRYDTAVQRPSPEELARASKAFGIGALLGLVLRILARPRRSG
jgi:hypothetical protein